MTRLCGECSRPCKKHGELRRLGSFLDQIVTCPACGWCGVESEVIEHENFIQLGLFDALDSGLPEFGARAHERGDDGEQADGGADRADTGSGRES